jgi:outer membrane protein OmpA-like peptidoglycan-associated protein
MKKKIMMRNAAIIFSILIFCSAAVKGQSDSFFDRHDYRIKPLPLINSAGSDISPAIVHDELYFSAVRDEFLGNERRKQRNMLFYDVYHTTLDRKGNPLKKRELVPGFGNLYHEGPVSWCEATGELFVTLSNVVDGDTLRGIIKQEHIRLRLVAMKQENGIWTITEEFPFNRDKHHIAHPAISKTGDTLVFTSDMPGGFGNSDLYISVRTDGTWSEPKNLGEKINTPGNEMFPTFGPGGMLFFSSDGHPGNYGQMDIYAVQLTGNTGVVNLGKEINSAYDDFGLVIHPSGNFGFFSSNRPGNGSDDIYHIEFIPLYENVGGRVVIKHNGNAVPGASIYLQDCNGNELQVMQTNQEGLFEFRVKKGFCYQVYAGKEGFTHDLKTYSGENFVEMRLEQIVNYKVLILDTETGRPLQNANATCRGKSWQSDSQGFAGIQLEGEQKCNFRISRDEYFDFTYDVDLSALRPGAEIADTIRLLRKQLNKSFLFEDLSFYNDMWRLLPESEKKLDNLLKLMQDNPDLKIEVGSHTDSRLADDFNLWLSQKRADSVEEYLVKNGVASGRIIPKGYGETRLLNHCNNWTQCTEAEHLVNRRTEFTILEF